MPPTLVVVSFFDQRPADCLHRLLRQLDAEAAGAGIDIALVVNATGAPLPALPRTERPVQVLMRENLGMNIGAWDHGWRALPGYARYIFLQDECVVRQPGWADAYAAALDDPQTGLAGESIAFDTTWAEAIGRLNKISRYRDLMADRWKIDPGTHATHLQSLIWAARREVLEASDGFPIGHTRHQCITAELAVSRRLVAMGFKLRLVGPEPFTWFSHGQWDGRVGPPAAADRGELPG